MSIQDFDNGGPMRRRQEPEGWGGALVMACLALGFVTSWASYEMHQRVAQQANESQARHDLDLLWSSQSDLGRLLADPRTKLVQLSPAGIDSPVRVASVAWNQESQSGAVFSEDLGDGSGREYQIWLVPASGAATAVAFGPGEPGRAVYLFRPIGQAARPSEMVLTPKSDADQPENALARGRLAD
jgi:hypothetical protein